MEQAIHHATTAGQLRSRLSEKPAGRLGNAISRLADQESAAASLALGIAMRRPIVGE